MSWPSYALGLATPLLALAVLWCWATWDELPFGDWSWNYNDRLHVFRGGARWPRNRTQGWGPLPLWIGRPKGVLFVRLGTRRTCLIYKREWKGGSSGEG